MRNSGFIVIFLSFMALLMMSCGKEDGAGCFVAAGDKIIQQRPLGDIRNIELYDNINLVLTQQDPVEFLLVEGGENLVYGVDTEVNGNRLIIRNNNRCNWTRDFNNPLNVYVPVRQLDSISYRGSGDITCTNTLFTDTLHVDMWEGSGSINFDLDCVKSRFYIHEGTIDLTAKGESFVCILSSRGFGPVNLLDLGCTAVYMDTESPNDCYVNVSSTLEEIKNIGNVYFMGNPPNINAKVNGGGQLIMLE